MHTNQVHYEEQFKCWLSNLSTDRLCSVNNCTLQFFEKSQYYELNYQDSTEILLLKQLRDIKRE